MTVGLRPRRQRGDREHRRIALWALRTGEQGRLALVNQDSRSLRPAAARPSGAGLGKERVCSIAPWTRIWTAPTSWSLAACQVLRANTTRGKGHDLGSGPKRMLPAPGKEVVSTLTSAQMVVVSVKEVRNLFLGLRIADGKGLQWHCLKAPSAARHRVIQTIPDSGLGMQREHRRSSPALPVRV